MNVPFNDLYAQYLSLKPEIDDAIERTIQNSAFVRGPEVELFEENFAKLMGLSIVCPAPMAQMPFTSPCMRWVLSLVTK